MTCKLYSSSKISFFFKF